MVPLSILLALTVLTATTPKNVSKPAALFNQNGVYSVSSFGAKGDGIKDDTKAFQNALDAAGKVGGGIVFVPTGNYLIKTHLSIPNHVTLEGVFRAPTRSTQYKGSTLLAVEGKGNADGDPFIYLHTNSTLKGITIFYPEQDKVDPKPYPWCVRGHGDNCTILDTLIVNPWQAVDFGSANCGRHYIKGLYSQPIYKGIFVDKCFDVGRIEDVHLWPFWDEGLLDYTKKNGTAFIFGKTDWEFVSGCFCIAYKVGFHFTEFKDGPGNVVLTNSGSDVGPCAVLVDNCQHHSGLAFTNCQIMAGVDIKESNTGPVKFNNCGFWNVSATTTHASIKGKGQAIFNSCHFIGWDQKKAGDPAIFADGSGLIVTACDFMDGSNKKKIVLGENLKSAIITSNRMRSGINIENNSKGKVEIGFNVDE